MNERQKGAFCFAFFRGEAGLLLGHAICVERCAIRRQDHDDLANSIGKCAKLRLVLLELPLGPLSIVNICAGTVPPDDLAGFVAEWVCANQKPAIYSVMAAKTRLDLVRLS